MNQALVGHERPVDRVASRLLWKSPWWAKYPEPAQKAILEVKVETTWQAWVDYTKAPTSGGKFTTPDRRGLPVILDDGTRGVISGYADCRVEQSTSKKNNPKPDWWVGGGWDPNRQRTVSKRYHFWWVATDAGFQRWSWKAIKLRIDSIGGAGRRERRERNGLPSLERGPLDKEIWRFIKSKAFNPSGFDYNHGQQFLRDGGYISPEEETDNLSDDRLREVVAEIRRRNP